MNVGKLWEAEIRKTLEAMCPIVIREYDLRGDRFTKPKQYDFICCTGEGRFVAVEAKATRKSTFPFASVSARQAGSLLGAVQAKGMVLLALNMRDEKGPGRAWLIPWSLWLRMEATRERKSIRREEVAEIFSDFELERVTGGWRWE